MELNCKTATKYFKERPEDILWYILYRNEKVIIYKNKRKHFDQVMDITEVPECLKIYKFFLKIGRIYLNMQEVHNCKMEPYIKNKENKLYHLIINFNNNPKIYLQLDDHSIENVINEQHRINLYLNKIRQGLI